MTGVNRNVSPRGQVQLRIVQRARATIGGLVKPVDEREVEALQRLAARDAAAPALVFPGAWWVYTGDAR